MDPLIRKYCKSIRKRHIEVLRVDKRTGTKFWDLPACASLCHNGDYGKTRKGYSHKPNGTKWHDVLRRKMKKELGDIGSRSNLGKHFYIGNCAEQHSGNNYMKKYKESNISSLRFSETVRPRTMEIIPPCDNCKKLFDTLK